jgi:hypothetical protein
MADFVGRTSELRLLRRRLDLVRKSERGTAVAVRGRRQVGKSRLVQEFCDQASTPYLYFTAIKGASPAEALEDFVRTMRESGLSRSPELLPDSAPTSWRDGFRLLASVLQANPSIVVIDELPWLAEQDEQFDGALQAAWDRLLSGKPVLLLLLGSDIHMMERLTAYDRPFFGRADNLVLQPLSPQDVGAALGVGPKDAIDAHLVSGGLPGVIRRWPHGMPAIDFLHQECSDPATPVFSIPESTLLAEFSAPDQARRVIEAVGGGERTYANIASAGGSAEGILPSGTLSPVLNRLVTEKRVLAINPPLSIRPGRPSLYRVADSNLRLYLAVGRAAHELMRRGRPDAAFRLIQRRWATWRGKAIEPLVRESLELASAAGSTPWPDAEAVGGWWNRQFNPEVDLIGADRWPVANRILFVGSVKWLATPYDRHDLTALVRSATAVPGYVAGQTGLAFVSLSGRGAAVGREEIQLDWGPADVVASWQS